MIQISSLGRQPMKYFYLYIKAKVNSVCVCVCVCVLPVAYTGRCVSLHAQIRGAKDIPGVPPGRQPKLVRTYR